MRNKKINADVKHNYHMVLPIDLKFKIEKLSIILGKSLSETAIHIVDKTLNFFKKIHFVTEESAEFSDYPYVNWDTELHVDFDKNAYRKVKHLADTHMAFSVAVVMRWIFNYYFDNLYDFETKKERIEEIESINEEIEEYEQSIKTWNKKIINQQLAGKFRYFLNFNDKFCITGFNFSKTS